MARCAARMASRASFPTACSRRLSHCFGSGMVKYRTVPDGEPENGDCLHVFNFCVQTASGCFSRRATRIENC